MSDAVHPNERDESWLAFRYVAGEMAADEIAEFENLLAESQPAREAVAAAVLLTQAVAFAGKSAQPALKPVPAAISDRAPTWRQRLTWALLGAAASLLFAWGLQAWRDSTHNGRGMPQTHQFGHEDLTGLALQWTAAGDYDNDADWSPEPRDSNESAAESRVAADASYDAEDFAAPDWLLAAVYINDMPPMADPGRDPNR